MSAAPSTEADAHFNRGVRLHQQGALQQAIEAYDRALALNPEDAEALFNRAHAFHGLGMLDDAAQSYELALFAHPGYDKACCNLGVVLKEKGLLAAATARYEQAISINPCNAEAHFNLGKVQKDLAQFDSAIASFSRATALKPDYADAYWIKATTLLLTGNYQEGWPLYEWRWLKPGFPSPYRKFAAPLWLGRESIAGKTLLLHSEQGLGDSIQFCRYAPLLTRLGANIVIQTHASLVPLLQQLEGSPSVLSFQQAPPPFDYHTPMLSLPLAMGTTVEAPPCPGRYLRSLPDKSAFWSNRLGAKTGIRVGIAWSSTSTFADDHRRSMSLASFLRCLTEIGDPRFEFVCLQPEIKSSDLETLQSRTDLRFFGRDIADFGDTAALIDNVDLVISTCTSVAHLAGALEKPLWLLLSHVPDWRWLIERTDSPWYRSAKLYRQSSAGDWSPPLDRVRRDLLELATHMQAP
ncbi:MAG: tetratricopeptide repeat-containing glycosyltransferase family protein [Rhodocyclaceae bacterium]|nr:tetratricopeptide repeat-containing glycosyltransferase family protein [Rhodocyclaceae bacterium]